MTNVYDVSILAFSPNAVEPQFGFPVMSRTVKLAASTTYPIGSWLGEITASPGTFGLWAHANVDGTQNPVAILPRAVVTDASGNIFEGAQASEEFVGVSHQNYPVFTAGCFRQSDIATTTAQTITDLKVTYPGAAIRSGTIAGGNALIQF